MAERSKRKIAGIDLGTTYSAIAHFDEYGKVDIIPNSDNERITPSVILFEEEEVIVGKIAKNQAVSNPENVVQFVKRHMGEPDWVRVINGREYTPEILSAIILKRIVSDAEDQLGEPITDVVITCPAYFNDNERKATMDAGKIAGLNVLGIINEPTAAAIAYGMNNLDKDVRALVYDLGGGTFDVTILHIDGNNVKVLATDGERRLGGKDWDDMLLNLVAEKFIEAHNIDPREDAESYQDLVIKVEDAKKTLSKKPAVKIFAQCGGKSMKLNVTRQEFEELTLPLLEQTETYLDVVLKKADLTWDQIDVVIPVGGMTRIPAVLEMLKRVTSKEPERAINPDECVAIGAAYWAAILMVREANQLQEKVQAGQATEEEKGRADSVKQAVTEAVPEEIVGMLGGVVVQNVNSHSLGIVTVQAGGVRKNLIMVPEQTPLPASVTKIFGTAQDNQVTVEIRILEGESEDPDECTEIGTCVISDLPPNRSKGSKVSVTYKYGEDGRIEVTAKDHQTGQEVRTQIRRDAQSLTEEEMSQRGEEIARLLAGGEEGAAAPAAHEAAEGDGAYYGQEGAEGYAAEGYAAEGAEGYAADGYAAEGAEGYAADGYAAEGAEGYAADGYAAEGYEGAEGYAAEGAEGYAAEGAEGYAAEGAEGYAAEGYAAEGAEGYGAEGYAEGYEGYAAEGAEGYAAEGAEGYAAEGYAAEGAEGYAAEGAEGYAAEGAEGYAAEGYAEGAEGYEAGGEYAEGAEGYEAGGEYAEGAEYAAPGGEAYRTQIDGEAEYPAEGGEYEAGYTEGSYSDSDAGYSADGAYAEGGEGGEGFADSADSR